MRKIYIVDAIAEAQAARAERTKVTADKVVAELALIGFAELGAENVATSDKRLALVDIGRHLGMFPTKRNGAPLPAANVNITITRDQVIADMDAVFKRVSAEQAKKRALN